MEENDWSTEYENARVSKQKSREKFKSILEELSVGKNFIDLSKDPSDYEDELRKEKQKHSFNLSSDNCKVEVMGWGQKRLKLVEE